MSSIEVDRARCVGLGLCELAVPDLFEVDGDGVLNVLGPVTSELLDGVREAVSSCPTEALRLADGGAGDQQGSE